MWAIDNPTHILLLLVAALLLFGSKRLPEIGKSLGTGIREFKRSVTGEADQPALRGGTDAPAPTQAAAVSAPPAPQPDGQRIVAQQGAAEPLVSQPAEESAVEHAGSTAA